MAQQKPQKPVTPRGSLATGAWHAASSTALLCSLLASCAVVERENRRLLSALDEHAIPASEPARWALAPIALPLGLAAVTTDAVIVHPATVLDDAWGDTVEWLWTSRGDSRFRRAVMLPLVTIATPVVFSGDWLGRAVFAFPPRREF